MLNRDEIQTALHAERAIPLKVRNPHGPLGLEQLRAALGHLSDLSAESNQIQRSISLPIETWAKLNDLAQQMSQQNPQPITATDLARSLVVQGIENATQL